MQQKQLRILRKCCQRASDSLTSQPVGSQTKYKYVDESKKTFTSKICHENWTFLHFLQSWRRPSSMQASKPHLRLSNVLSVVVVDVVCIVDWSCGAGIVRRRAVVGVETLHAQWRHINTSHTATTVGWALQNYQLSPLICQNPIKCKKFQFCKFL